MSLNRKEFLKKACVTGACFCGFGGLANAMADENIAGPHESEPDSGKQLVQTWTANLLQNLSSELDPELVRSLVKKNSIVHYNDLKMNEMLSDYIGQPEKFIQFISEKWGWVITFDKATGVLIADENKSYCVCPVVNQANNIGSPATCYCSEGFAEKMFSAVFQRAVKAEVISSVLRGNASCRYKIIIG
jgi:predicted hydrocarbon binding protein